MLLLYRHGVPTVSYTHLDVYKRQGMCPMEETVLHLTDPSEAFSALEKTIARLMQEKAQITQKN